MEIKVCIHVKVLVSLLPSKVYCSLGRIFFSSLPIPYLLFSPPTGWLLLCHARNCGIIPWATTSSTILVIILSFLHFLLFFLFQVLYTSLIWHFRRVSSTFTRIIRVIYLVWEAISYFRVICYYIVHT